MRYISYTVVLLLCCTIACVASVGHKCIFDQISRNAGSPVAVVVQEVSRQRNSSGEQAIIAALPKWGNIRIRYFTEDINDPKKYCTSASDIRSNFQGGTAPCTVSNVLTHEKKSLLVNKLIPAAIKLHADRLLVRSVIHSLKVPTFTRICGNFTIPSAHHTVGVDNADTVMYIAAGTMPTGTRAWAVPCASIEDGRPVVSVMNFGGRATGLSEFNIRIAAHEIGHALGFQIIAMTNNRVNVKEIPNVRGKPKVTVVASLKTKEKTREHFNCDTTDGMELEDEGGTATALSHWERRNAKDELMSGTMGAMRYTALTMALMYDLGVYDVVWEKAEPMSWGKGAGCNLLTDKCVKDGVSQFPDMFCNSNSGPLRCTSDRYALGSCDIMTHQLDLPIYFQYFSDPRHGGTVGSLMDYCPFIKDLATTWCHNGDQNMMPGSRISMDSLCVKGSNLIMRGQNVGDVCVELSCQGHTIQLRYFGDDTWYDCPEGKSITPTAPFTGGQIVCPPREEVCFGLRDKSDEPTTKKSPKNGATLSVSLLVPSVLLAVVISMIVVS